MSVNTYHHEANTRVESPDCAIVVKHDGMLAATVVHGRGPVPNSSVSKQYCALITAAALDTVKRAVLGNGLQEQDLQRYFFETVKLSDQNSAFNTGDDAKFSRDVTFGGVVLFFDKEGNRKRFVYGLGNIAVASRSTSNLVLTQHLQGNVMVANDYIDHSKNSFTPTLGVINHQDNFKAQMHVTAQVFDVGTVTESIQVMTGCDQAFYDFDSEQKGTDGAPNKLRCENFPAHGEFVERNPFNATNDDALHLSINAQVAFESMPGLPDSFEFK